MNWADVLGEIEDLVLDPRTGRLDYVVVSRGGFLGLGEEQVAVPWQALRATPDFASFVLPVSEEAMDGAPALSDVDATGAVTPVDDYWTEAIRTSRPVVND